MKIDYTRWACGMIAGFMITTWVILILFAPGCKSWGLSPLKDGVAPDSSKNPLASVTKSVNWLATISIIGLAFSIAALVNGYKWGMGGAVGSGVALWAVLTVTQYAKWIAVLGLLVGIVVFVVAVLRNKNVLVDVIKSVERGKDRFINRSNLVTSLKTQKPTTQKVVNKIRKKLNGKNKDGK